MNIIDAQVHIWGADTPERPWPGQGHQPHRPHPFSMTDLLREMDAAGVNRCIIVPPMWEGDRNDLALEAARLHPDRFAVTGLMTVDSPAARGSLAAWRRQPGMLGLRLVLTRPRYRTLFEAGAFDWLWAEAEEAQVPIMLLVDMNQAPLLHPIARRHPGLKITLDHLAVPRDTKDEAAFAGLDNVLALAQFPNVAVKLTALPHFSADEYPYRRLHPTLRRVYEAFGPQRMFWGTDLTRLSCSYSEAVRMFTEEIPWLTSADKEWIMGRGISTWLDWK
ncbi:MAG: Metal-dependent hydrolase [Betaproteobacteria bacterium]|nr:Metal-dependent hydrolase [Betaproteobacteria bacterium]